jgi:phospholipase C
MNQYPEPSSEKLQKTIQHVVVLMLENRSFDNLLGWLYSADPPYDKPPSGQHYEGLRHDLWNPLDNIDPDGIRFKEAVPVEKNGQPKQLHGRPLANPVDFTQPNPDPGEGFRDTNHQLFQEYQIPQQYPPLPVNMGFVQNYQNAMLYGAYGFGDAPSNPRSIMKCYTPEQTPVLSALARAFAVCDHYHCSVPSQTLPNRDFVHAATSTGHVNNGPVATCDARTIFNQIQSAIDGGRKELSWGVFGNNLLSSSKDKPGEFAGDHFSLTRLILTQLHDARFDGNFGTVSDFEKKCKSGALPSYSFLEPCFGGEGQNDQHPPSDIRPGEQLIADVYEMIKASPAFSKTLFIITYDEHGGCYDHVPPPSATPPEGQDKPGQEGFWFNRMGLRVPCVVVSPYIEAGLIARAKGYTPFDHTSIIKTVQLCFGLEGHLTERDRNAPDFSGLLSRVHPRSTAELPEVHALACERRAAPHPTNELHRTLAHVLGKMTGKQAPNAGDVLGFIQRAYSDVFRQSGKR